jgi:uncharacterized protein (TIGR04222 family)
MQVVTARFVAPDLNVYQLLHFMYGKHRALQAALLDLVQRNLLQVNDDETMTIYAWRYTAPETESNPLIPALLATPDGAVVEYETIAMDWYRQQDFSSNLETLSERVYPHASYVSLFSVLIPAGGIGIIRIIQGVVNDRPVGALLTEMILMLVGFFIIKLFCSKGNLVFEKAKEWLEQKAAGGTLHADNTVAGFAVNGYDVLAGVTAGAILVNLFTLYPPVMPDRTVIWKERTDPGGSCSSGSDYGSTSSCSSTSSCGGGSSCGGCSGSSD